MEQKKLNDREAKCPYLEYHTKSNIVCEGLIPGTRMRTVFHGEREKRKQYTLFCCGRYACCEICQALDKIKYGEE